MASTHDRKAKRRLGCIIGVGIVLVVCAFLIRFGCAPLPAPGPPAPELIGTWVVDVELSEKSELNADVPTKDLKTEVAHYRGHVLKFRREGVVYRHGLLHREGRLYRGKRDPVDGGITMERRPYSWRVTSRSGNRILIQTLHPVSERRWGWYYEEWLIVNDGAIARKGLCSYVTDSMNSYWIATPPPWTVYKRVE